MSRWPKVALGEVLRYRKDFIQIDDTEKYKRCRVQLHAQGIVLRDTVTGAHIKTKRQQVCRAGEFLVAEIDAKHGGFGLVPTELDSAIVSSHYFLFEIDDSRLERQFLDYFCRTPDFRGQVEAQGSTNYAAIRPADVLNYSIPLPSFDEQRAIVARLGAVVEKMRQVEAKLDEIEADTTALIISLHHELADSRTVQLGEVLELHEEIELIQPDSEYPQVGVRGFGGGLFAKPAVRSTDTTYRAFNRLYPDAIVLSQVKGWEGALARCPKSLAGFYVSPEYRTFRCIPGKVSPAYMGELIKTPWFWRLLLSATRGVGARRERTRPEQFLAIEFPMPKFPDQVKGAEVLARLKRTKAKHAETRKALKALLPSMLEQIFRSAE
jgi:type I restriction enzyme S subunit